MRLRLIPLVAPSLALTASAQAETILGRVVGIADGDTANRPTWSAILSSRIVYIGNAVKRLVFNNLKTQASQPVTDTQTPSPTDTATVTPGLELAEIIAAWTKLPPEIRTAVLTVIRVSKLDATCRFATPEFTNHTG